MDTIWTFISQIIQRPSVQLAFWGVVDVAAVAVGGYVTKILKKWQSDVFKTNEIRQKNQRSSRSAKKTSTRLNRK